MCRQLVISSAVFLLVLAVLVATVRPEPVSTLSENQVSNQEMEKWLEEFTQYLHQQESNNYAEQDAGRSGRFPTGPSYGGRGWPQWVAYKNQQQRKMQYNKRNSELINSMLGLPRIMKVSG